MAAGNPLGDHEGTVGDIGLGLDCPAVAIGLNGLLIYRAEGCKSSKAFKIGAGIGQLHDEGLGIGSRNTERIRFGAAVDNSIKVLNKAENRICIGCSRRRIGNTLPAVYEVLSGQVRTVRPLQAVTQMEGPGQAVF